MAKSLYWYAARLDKSPNDKLFAHQLIPIQYWRNNPEQRGLLLAIEPGLGKTRIMATLADEFEGDFVLYMAPKSLKEMLLKEIHNIGKDPNKASPDGIPRYHHVSINAGNIYQQWHAFLDTIKIDILDITPDTKHIDKIVDKPKILIIIDEGHILSQRVAHILNKIYYGNSRKAEDDPEEKGAYKLYEELRDAIHVKYLFATGTPIPNDPFDVVPMLNILRGRIYGVGGDFSYAFPDVYGKFYYNFVNIQNMLHERMDWLFATRIQNLIYWYKIPRGIPNIPIPDVSPDHLIRLNMEEQQWNMYLRLATKEELLEKRMSSKVSIQEGQPMIREMGVYKSFTRQASNFTYSDDIIEGESKVAQLKDKDLTLPAIKKAGIKIWAIVTSVLEEKNKIHAVYSHFVNDYGIAVFERVFMAQGWKPLEKDTANTIEELQTIYKKDKAPRFATLTGKQTVETKTRMIHILNTKINAEQRLVRCILFSGAAGHGITIYSVEKYHKLEADWNIAEEEQAQDRFARLFSAMYLPLNRRKLDIYKYIALGPKGTDAFTTDAYIYNLANEKHIRNMGIQDFIASASISCPELYKEENALHKDLIKHKIVPPIRIHMQCRACHSELVPNLILQAGVDIQCDDSKPYIKGKTITVKSDDKTYILSTETGHGWLVSKEDKKTSLVLDARLLRALWSLVL